MSLLLDALKKAASEKEKLKATEDGEADALIPDSSDIEEPDVMDLDLDMPEADEVYPEIDEVVSIPEIHEEKSPEPDKSVIEDKQDIETGKPELEESIDDLEVVVEQEAESISVTDEAIEPEPAPDEIKPEPTLQPIIKKEYGIKNKEALSELINKSNKYSRRKKLQTKIIIASTISLVFLLTASYLYFEFAVESQDIYVSNDSSAPVKAIVSRSNRKSENKANNDASEVVAKVVVANEQPSKAKQKYKKIAKPISEKKQSIKIVHKTIKDPIESLVRRAYDAFNQQDYKTSERLYKRVISEDSKNRDALLGLAAIGMKQQRYEYSRQKYLQLRYLNPRDSIAIAGLSSIQNKIKPELNESELKFMLREQPESAHLYFALGSQYAGQKKWAEAQASFFSAWSAENTNADYAFNLAVSLDRLGKKVQAKQFYELSLKLNKANKGNFSTQVVEKRISSLSKKND